MKDTDKLNSHLESINNCVDDVISMLRRLSFTVCLHAVTHIPRTSEDIGPLNIEHYNIEKIPSENRLVILQEISKALKPAIRNEEQLGANRLVGSIVIDASKQEELEFVGLINRLNNSKKEVGEWLSSNYQKMHERMAFINKNNSPLKNIIMATVHRKIHVSPSDQNMYFKSVTFSWTEKGIKTYKITSREQLSAHLVHYNKVAEIDLICSEQPSVNNPLTVFIPQRVHPVVNIAIANEEGRVVQRWPHKAHTPIFTFKSRHTKIKDLAEYNTRTGLSEPGPQYEPVRPDLSLYRRVPITS